MNKNDVQGTKLEKEPDMDNVNTSDALRYPPGTSKLTEIFDSYARECITDEQIQRVLEPVIREILEGRFNR